MGTLLQEINQQLFGSVLQPDMKLSYCFYAEVEFKYFNLLIPQQLTHNYIHLHHYILN